MRALVIVCVLLAGCSVPTEPVAEATVEARALADGDWWRYDATILGVEYDLTLVYMDGRFLLDDENAARELAAAQVPLLGQSFSNGTWSGTFWEHQPLQDITTPVEMVWTRWPVNATPVEEPRRRYSQGDGSSGLEAHDVDAYGATFSYSGPVAGTARFNVTLGWLTELQLDAPIALQWKLVEHGGDYAGEAWSAEQRMRDHAYFTSLNSYGIPTNGGNVARVQVDLECNQDVYSMRLGDMRPDPTPYVEHRGVCPASIHETTWIEGLPEYLGYESEGPATEPGTVVTDILYVEKVL